MNNTILSTENLTYVYPDGTEAIKNINLNVEKGEKVAIIGPNGAGKSTLLSHLNGLIEPSKGIVKVKGKEMKYDKKSLLKIRQVVGVVFQNPDNQLFSPSVIEDVAFGPMNLGLDINEVNKRVKESLRMVNMEGFEKKLPHHLSGGQKKRVIIAGILAMHPEIMILDEPTSGLDPQGVDQIMKILNQQNEKGMSIIISSHDIEMISEFADKIYVLSNGKIINYGSPEEVFQNYELLKEAKLKAPKCFEILNLLKKEGLDVNPNKISVKETCEEIVKAKKSF